MTKISDECTHLTGGQCAAVEGSSEVAHSPVDEARQASLSETRDARDVTHGEGSARTREGLRSTALSQMAGHRPGANPAKAQVACAVVLGGAQHRQCSGAFAGAPVRWAGRWSEAGRRRARCVRRQGLLEQLQLPTDGRRAVYHVWRLHRARREPTTLGGQGFDEMEHQQGWPRTGPRGGEPSAMRRGTRTQASASKSRASGRLSAFAHALLRGR